MYSFSITHLSPPALSSGRGSALQSGDLAQGRLRAKEQENDQRQDLSGAPGCHATWIVDTAAALGGHSCHRCWPCPAPAGARGQRPQAKDV